MAVCTTGHVPKVACLLVSVLIAIYASAAGADGLTLDYYRMSCPYVDMMVRQVVYQAIQKDPTIAAGLLRLHFHDCFVQGCDASILIDSTSGNIAEKDSPPNLSLRGYEVIDEVKQRIEERCPGVVSCADILALAARDAVMFARGPFYPVPLGRRDGTRSSIRDTGALPAPSLDAAGLIQIFVGKHGFTVPELVALSGGHTLGVSHCSSFNKRLHNFNSTNDVDPTLESSFAESLATTCGSGSDSSTTVAFDATPNTFDTDYFGELQAGRGVLASDQALYTAPETQTYVARFNAYRGMFYYYFQQGMLKMGQLDLKQGDDGEVRLSCRKIN